MLILDSFLQVDQIRRLLSIFCIFLFYSFCLSQLNEFKFYRFIHIFYLFLRNTKSIMNIDLYLLLACSVVMFLSDMSGREPLYKKYEKDFG